MIIALIISGAIVVGLLVGTYIAEQEMATKSAGSLLDRCPDVAARDAQINIAADVRLAEEQIHRLNQPGVGRPIRP